MDLDTFFKNRARAAAWTALMTVLSYLVWLAWDQPLAPQNIDSPRVYEVWQASGAAVTLAALTAAVTWFNDGRLALVVVPTVFTTVVIIDAVPDAWLWPLSAIYAGLGSFLVVLIAYVNTRTVHRGLRAD